MACDHILGILIWGGSTDFQVTQSNFIPGRGAGQPITPYYWYVLGKRVPMAT